MTFVSLWSGLWIEASFTKFLTIHFKLKYSQTWCLFTSSFTIPSSLLLTFPTITELTTWLCGCTTICTSRQRVTASVVGSNSYLFNLFVSPSFPFLTSAYFQDIFKWKWGAGERERVIGWEHTAYNNRLSPHALLSTTTAPSLIFPTTLSNAASFSRCVGPTKAARYTMSKSMRSREGEVAEAWRNFIWCVSVERGLVGEVGLFEVQNGERDEMRAWERMRAGREWSMLRISTPCLSSFPPSSSSSSSPSSWAKLKAREDNGGKEGSKRHK